MSATTFVIDTNFVLRYLLADNAAQSQETNAFFKNVKSGLANAILEQAVFTEIVFVLLSFYKVSREEIFNTLNNFLLYKGVKTNDKELLLQALEIFINTKLHIVDCIVIAKAHSNNYALKSFDSKLQKTFKQL